MTRTKQMTDEELLEIALACFLEHGYNISTQMIAKEVGLSQAALFKRFGTKEEMFLQALTPPAHLPVIDWIDASPNPERPLKDQLVELLDRVNEMLNWVLPRVALLKASLIPRETVMERYETPPPVLLVQSLIGFFKRAKEQGILHSFVNPETTAQWVFGSLMGRNYLNELTPDIAKEADMYSFIEEMTNFMCHGIMKSEWEEK